jgi:hypothetical protein
MQGTSDFGEYKVHCILLYTRTFRTASKHYPFLTKAKLLILGIMHKKGIAGERNTTTAMGATN